MDNARRDKQKMRILDFTMKILILSGGGRPNSWTTPCKRLIYHSYTVSVILLIYAFMLPQLLDLIINVDNSDDFTDNFYVLFSIFVSSCKVFSLLINRSNIVMFVDILTKRPFRPTESDEVEIYQKFDRLIRLYTHGYAAMFAATFVCFTTISFFACFKKGNLMFRAWLPFDYSPPLIFLLLYVHQLISFMFAALHHLICDSFICGLLMHICCQIEVLECRLRKSSRNPDILRECVLHHDYIYKFSATLNDKFKYIIFMQFIVSMFELCFALYQITFVAAMKYLQVIMAMCALLSQIFFYCWYGNEVKLKSLQLVNSVFEMDWFRLDKNAKNTLLMIMRRGTMPIEFKCAYIMTVNLETFMTLLKMSYSAYNILQQT